jgi:hypothetical protein
MHMPLGVSCSNPSQTPSSERSMRPRHEWRWMLTFTRSLDFAATLKLVLLPRVYTRTATPSRARSSQVLFAAANCTCCAGRTRTHTTRPHAHCALLRTTTKQSELGAPSPTHRTSAILPLHRRRRRRHRSKPTAASRCRSSAGLTTPAKLNAPRASTDPTQSQLQRPGAPNKQSTFVMNRLITPCH